MTNELHRSWHENVVVTVPGYSLRGVPHGEVKVGAWLYGPPGTPPTLRIEVTVLSERMVVVAHHIMDVETEQLIEDIERRKI